VVRPSIWRRVSPVAPAAPGGARQSRAAAGAVWVLDAKFDRVLMAQGLASSDVMAHAET
jgi:hypothetical protein